MVGRTANAGALLRHTAAVYMCTGPHMPLLYALAASPPPDPASVCSGGRRGRVGPDVIRTYPTGFSGGCALRDRLVRERRDGREGREEGTLRRGYGEGGVNVVSEAWPQMIVRQAKMNQAKMNQAHWC